MKEKTLFVIMIVNIIITLVWGFSLLVLDFIHKSSSETIRNNLYCSEATCPNCTTETCDCYYCEDEACDTTVEVKCPNNSEA